MKHMEGNWLAAQPDRQSKETLSIVGENNAEYYTNDARYIHIREAIEDGTLVWVRGTLHRGDYRLGGAGGGMLANDHLYLQVHGVVLALSASYDESLTSRTSRSTRPLVAD